MFLANDADHNLIEAPDIVPAWQLAAQADVVKIQRSQAAMSSHDMA
jgi:hypothetical protein